MIEVQYEAVIELAMNNKNIEKCKDTTYEKHQKGEVGVYYRIEFDKAGEATHSSLDSELSE